MNAVLARPAPATDSSLSLPKLSPTLSTAISLYEDESRWTLPKGLTAETIEEAKRALPGAEELMKPAAPKIVVKWLTALGIHCAGTIKEVEAEARVAAYGRTLADLAAPACFFTRSTLTAAATKFPFFPDFANLIDFLKEETQDIRRTAERLRKIAEAKTTPRLTDDWGAKRDQNDPFKRLSLTKAVAAAIDGATRAEILAGKGQDE